MQINKKTSPSMQLTHIANIEKGEMSAAHSRPLVTEVKQSPNRQNGELSAATRRTCKNGGFVVQ